MNARIIPAIALGALLAACGTNPDDRVQGGAAAGAATGAAVGALAGPPGVVVGGLVGAGAGAATGAATSPQDVNLGRPVWNNPEVRVPGVREGRGNAGYSSTQTRELQRALNARGFDAGPADGVWGARTRSAVMEWQRQNNVPVTGTPTASMLNTLGVQGSGMAPRAAAPNPNAAYMGGGMAGEPRPRGAEQNLDQPAGN
jgi:peptidoglycan hydrolase-like protein with peptidoglycan-binding domain